MSCMGCSSFLKFQLQMSLAMQEVPQSQSTGALGDIAVISIRNKHLEVGDALRSKQNYSRLSA